MIYQFIIESRRFQPGSEEQGGVNGK